MKNVVKNVPQLGRIEAEKGIFAPKPELLNVGEYIYRFASHSAGFGYHAGSWWIRQTDFELIVERATRRGVDLGQKARWDLAVLQKWGSKMNVVVEARVASRLWAWTGLAKPQQETTPNGKIIRLFGNPQIRQLFLYDVIDRSGMLTPRGREGLAVTGAKIISSTPFY
jgi:hypothetical protein